MTGASRRRTRHPLTLIVRAAGALLAVALVVAGPPLLLTVLVGDPLPHQLPTATVISGWLRAPISDREALDVIAVLAWAAWLHLCGCILAEFTRQLRGTCWHVPCGGINARLAQHLVAAVLIAGPSATLSAGAAASLLTPAPVAHATTTSPSARPINPASKLRFQTSSATVLLSAAAAAGSRGRPSSAVTDSADDYHSAPPIYKEYVVAPPDGQYHDNLWDIAARHLGDPLRWKEIFALNDGRLMSDGQRMTRASLIQPGWVLRMPADATGLRELPAPAAQRRGSSERQDRAPQVAPPPRHPAPRTPAETPPRTPAVAVEPRPEVAPNRQIEPQQARPTQIAAAHRRRDPAVPVGAGLSMAALGLLAALERRRRVAARRRTPGTRLARPGPELRAAEARIRRYARDATVVAATVRLAVALAASRDPQLTVRAAWHHPDGTVELLLDTTRTPPEPFTGTGTGPSWLLAPAEQGYLFAVGDNTDPVPVLIPVGTSDGAVCYVNLEVSGLVGLDGPRPDVDAVIAGMVRALAGAPWAEELTQLLVPPRLGSAVIGLERVDVLHDPPSAFERLTAYAEKVSTEMTGQATLAQARRTGDADTIRVVVLAGLTAGEVPDRLRDAAGTPTAPVLALLVGSHPDAQTWTLTDGWLSIPGIAERLEPLRVEPDEIDITEALLTQAFDTTPATPGDPDSPEVSTDCPPAPEPQQIEVQILGPVGITGVDRIRREAVLGLIVYLALHRRPAGSEQIFTALWPDKPLNRHIVRSRIGEAKTLLNGGIDLHGQRWTLAESIGCDWQRFQALATGDPSEQLAALALVRGRPFHGYDADWVHLDGYAQSVEAAIVDLALTVAERALTDADPATATTAATAGLRACPYDERLYQIAIAAAAARGATGEVKALRRQFDRAMDEHIEPDDHVQPDTIDTYERAVRSDRRAVG
jgi:DNA-binding SARP family transcriptional activator